MKTMLGFGAAASADQVVAAKIRKAIPDIFIRAVLVEFVTSPSIRPVQLSERLLREHLAQRWF